MLDHISLQARDVEASVTFYLAVFGPLGFREAMRYPTPNGPVVGLSGPDGFPHFWLGPATDDCRRETHVAFTAADRESVDRVHTAASRPARRSCTRPGSGPSTTRATTASSFATSTATMSRP